MRDIAWYRIHGNILLDSYRAIYFDIPKVACSSLKSVWSDVLKVEVKDGKPAEQIHLAHFPYVKTYQIRNKYAHYFKFCFVRNPWDRLVSCYMDKIKDAQGGIYQGRPNYFIRYLERRGICATEMTFEQFVEAVCGIPDEEADSHFRSQHCYIEDHRGHILVDFAGRFETLNSDFKFVADKLGIDSTLPHLRRTSRIDFRDYYTTRSRELVRKRYAVDIELFGYSFDCQPYSSPSVQDSLRHLSEM